MLEVNSSLPETEMAKGVPAPPKVRNGVLELVLVVNAIQQQFPGHTGGQAPGRQRAEAAWVKVRKGAVLLACVLGYSVTAVSPLLATNITATLFISSGTPIWLRPSWSQAQARSRWAKLKARSLNRRGPETASPHPAEDGLSLHCLQGLGARLRFPRGLGAAHPPSATASSDVRRPFRQCPRQPQS